jgi:hypothetical protein
MTYAPEYALYSSHETVHCLLGLRQPSLMVLGCKDKTLVGGCLGRSLSAKSCWNSDLRPAKRNSLMP